MHLALSTGVFGTEPLLELMPVIRQAGFRRLELVDRSEQTGGTDALDAMVRQAATCGIDVPNWHLIQESPFCGRRRVRRDAVERTKQSIERGAGIGARNHVLHWYHRFLDRGCDSLWREVVDEWADHAARLGVRLLMETVPDKPSNERYVPSQEIFEFVCNYPPETLSICIDVNHSNLREQLPDVAYAVRERLVSLHVSDNDGHAERHWLPGQGVIDYPSLFAGLEAAEFDGLFVLEVGKWCEQPRALSAISRLHEFGATLLETGSPHPGTPMLEPPPV